MNTPSNPNEPGSNERANIQAEGGGESPPRTLKQWRFRYGRDFKATSAGYHSFQDAVDAMSELRRMGFSEFTELENYEVPATPDLVAELRKWSRIQSAVGMMDLSRILAEAAIEIERLNDPNELTKRFFALPVTSVTATVAELMPDSVIAVEGHGVPYGVIDNGVKVGSISLAVSEVAKELSSGHSAARLIATQGSPVGCQFITATLATPSGNGATSPDGGKTWIPDLTLPPQEVTSTLTEEGK